MAPTQCCPICPHQLRNNSGLHRHQRHCDEYKIYMDARRVLYQQLELEATLTDAVGETPRSSHSPSPQHEPVAGDVMDFPHTEPSTTRPPTPMPLSPRLDPSSPPPPPGRNVMAFLDTEPPPSCPSSPIPLNLPLAPLPPCPPSPHPALSQSGCPLRHRLACSISGHLS